MRRPKGQPIVGRGTAAGGGGSAQKAQHSKSPGGGVHLLDRQLVPRVEAYGQAHPLTDADAVANALRQAHREYARRPQAAFRAMVLKAIRAVQARLQQDQPEAEAANNTTPTPSDGAAEPGGGAAAGDKDANGSQEDGKERDMQVSSSAASSSASGSSGASSSSSGGSSSSSSDASDSEADAEEGPRNKGGMNNMLLSMYARTPQANASAGGSRPGDAGPATQGRTTVGKHEPAPPAFAPPEVVAAAAARALAAQKAAASGKQTKPGKSSNAGVPAAPAPQAADSAALAATAAAAAGADANGALQPACAAGAATPGQQQTASKPNARTATEAGLQQEGRPGPSTVKRARRGGAGAAGAGGAGPRPRANSAVVSARPVTYADLGGVEDVLVDIRELIEYPLKHPEVYSWLGVEPPRGVLLHGPPGCGKTALANAIANECGVPFLRVSAPEIVSGMSGESEAKLRGLFQEAADLAPCIVFIDEIDAIAPKRETAQREMERRIVAQMLTCMDDLSAPVSSSTAQGQGQPHDRHAPSPAAPAGSVPNPHAGTDDIPARPSRPHVVVIGATNRPDALDPALRRAGRFDREITLGIPSEGARAKILAVITRGLRLAGDFDFKAIAKRTPGFVGADLMALVKEAAALAVTRIFATLHDQDQQAQAASAAAAAAPIAGPAAATEALEQGQQQQQQQGDADMADATASATAAPSAPGPAAALQATQAAAGSGANPGIQAAAAIAPGAEAEHSVGALLAGRSSSRFGGGPLGPAELRGLAISMADFEVAVRKVQPSVRREGFTTTPDVTWEDVGSLDEVREELSFSITAPIMHPERFQAMGMTTATGVLLYGPPGCGKTLVAKAVAHESGANFISIKGPELLNKYVGESERAVRQLFARARAAHPCVLFFDELDALAPRRGTDTNQAAERVVNQLLTEMDGVDGRQGVYVVAATNRPDMIDPALLRPGRLDKVLYVPLPPPDGRAAILRALTRRTPLGPDVDVTALGLSQRCTGFSGADMAALVREASVLALKEAMKQDLSKSSSWGQASTAAGAAGSDAQAVGAQPGSAAGSGAGGGEVMAGCVVAMHHFEAALARMSPSVSKRDARMYDALRKSLQGNLRSRLEANEELLATAKTATPEDVAAVPTGNAAAATTDARGAAQPPTDDGASDAADPMILA